MSKWTIELRIQKQIKLDEGIIDFPNWIKIDGKIDGTLDIDLGAAGTVHNSVRPCMALDKWIHITLICRGT